MAWIDNVSGITIPLTSKSASAATYNETGSEEFRELGTVVKVVAWNQRFDQTEITETFELDGLSVAAAGDWLGASPATRTKTWAQVTVNPDDAEKYHVKLDYLAQEVVETRSISQSSSAGSYRITLTRVTQTTVPISASDPVE